MSRPGPHHLLLRYRSHGDLLQRAGPLIAEAAQAGSPVVIVVPDTEGRLWVQHLNDLDVLASGSSIRLLVYPVNLRGWAWGVRAAYVAAQRALEERLEVDGREVLVVVRLPDVLLLVGEHEGVREVEDILGNIALLGTVVCAYHETLSLPGDIEKEHGVAA